MNYIDEIFERLNIQNIREFLLHGAEEMNISPQSYKERIDEKQIPAIEYIRSKFPYTDECEEITGKVYDYASACEEVYMEIGMQCGAELAMQLFDREDRVRR